ncbi:hypothetical protein [Actinomadura geliboluensis]|uniref:hypothetical protein n=1 Tax=Actinomadura geliboluensis TaxID=882440 RepID=UPI0036BCC9B4
MTDRWSAVLQLVAANTLYAGGIGYALGRRRPIHQARRWAKNHVVFRVPAGRLKSALVIALLPDVFVPLIWHRIRHGRYPAPPPRRRSPAPALIQKHKKENP